MHTHSTIIQDNIDRYFCMRIKNRNPRPSKNLMILTKFIKKKLERYKLSDEKISNLKKYKFIMTFYQAVIEAIERERDQLSHCIA